MLVRTPGRARRVEITIRDIRATRPAVVAVGVRDRLRFASVSPLRRCSRSACGKTAAATLTYVYADSTAVVGPLAAYAEPHCYDLCAVHAAGLTAPRGWEVVRLEVDAEALRPSADDLEALADAVREAGRPPDVEGAAQGHRPADQGGHRRSPSAPGGDGGPQGRRGHLRVLPSPS